MNRIKTHILAATLFALSGATMAVANEPIALQAPFDPDRPGHRAAVPHRITEVTFDARAWNPVARVTVNGGDPGAWVPLAVGGNVIEVVVEGGGHRRAYTVTVTRAAAPDATDTTDDTGTAEDANTPDNTNTPDNADTGNGNNGNTGNGNSGGSGGGPNPVFSGDNALAALTVTGAGGEAVTLSPAFTRARSAYTAAVPDTVTALAIAPTTRHDAARARVNGAAVGRGQARSVPLKVGENPVEIAVTAENGSRRTYTLTVTRAAPATDATLPALVVTGEEDSGVPLSPVFDPDTPAYTAHVAHDVTEVTLTPGLRPGQAGVTIAGQPVTQTQAGAAPPGTEFNSVPSPARAQTGVPVSLKVGENPIAVTVTAGDNATTRTYTVTLVRAAPVAVPAMATQQRVLPDLSRALADDTGDSLAARLETLRRPAAPAAAAVATYGANTAAADAGAAATTATPGNPALTRLGQALAGILPGASSSAMTPPQDAFDPARADARVHSGWETPAAPANWTALLDKADFVLPLRHTHTGGETPLGLDSLSLWSDGSYKNLGGPDTGLNWRGDLLGARLGADMRLSESLNAGAAFSWQRAGWDVSDGAGDADRTLTLLSVTPYAGWTNQRLNAWASAGTGWGTLDSRRDAAAHSEDVNTRMVSGGLAGRLWDSAAVRVQLKAEGLLTGMATESLEIDSHRLRVSLEADHTRRLSDTATLTPTLQLGVRQDGGAGRGGTGMELGGSLRYAGTSLTLYGRGRTLIGRDGYNEWGVQGLAEWRARLNGRGLFLRLSPGYGYAHSGIEQLWTQGLRQEAASHVPRDYAARLDVQLSYGWDAPWHRGRITPTLEMQLQPHATAYRLGTRWALPRNLQLRLLGERREGNTDTDHALLLEGALRF